MSESVIEHAALEISGKHKRKIDAVNYHVNFHEPPELEVSDKVLVTIGGVLVTHGIVYCLGSEKEYNLWEGMRVDEGKALVILTNTIVRDATLPISDKNHRESQENNR